MADCGDYARSRAGDAGPGERADAVLEGRWRRRPLEFGRRIGALVRELRALPKAAALTRLVAEHDLDPGAAENLMEFLADQEAATGAVPDDRTW